MSTPIKKKYFLLLVTCQINKRELFRLPDIPEVLDRPKDSNDAYKL